MKNGGFYFFMKTMLNFGFPAFPTTFPQGGGRPQAGAQRRRRRFRDATERHHAAAGGGGGARDLACPEGPEEHCALVGKTVVW